MHESDVMRAALAEAGYPELASYVVPAGTRAIFDPPHGRPPTLDEAAVVVRARQLAHLFTGRPAETLIDAERFFDLWSAARGQPLEAP